MASHARFVRPASGSGGHVPWLSRVVSSSGALLGGMMLSPMAVPPTVMTPSAGPFSMGASESPAPLRRGLTPIVQRRSPQGSSRDSASPPQTATSTSTGHLLLETQGRLEVGDRMAFQDGSLYDEYAIEGTAGQQLYITLESPDFDPYLIVIGPQGNVVARHDDIAPDNLNATLDVVLPADGTYHIVANGYDRFSRGQYVLTVRTPQRPPSSERPSSTPGSDSL